jgi:dihydroorotase-like cyclic amidohydrolase
MARVMSGDQGFDLILRGGRAICPASDIDATKDAGVRNATVAAIGDRILESSAKQASDVAGKLVLPGRADPRERWGAPTQAERDAADDNMAATANSAASRLWATQRLARFGKARQ